MSSLSTTKAPLNRDRLTIAFIRQGRSADAGRRVPGASLLACYSLTLRGARRPGGRYTSSAPADHQRRPLSQQWLRATQAQAGGVLQDGRLPSWSLPRLVPGVLTGRGALDSLAEDV